MGTTVLLRHTLPDGSSHFDWLFEEAEGAPSLRSFRVTVRIDLADPPSAFDAVAAADHRPAYLNYEGPVSRGRGEVSRIATGTVRMLPSSAHAAQLRLECDWGRGTRRIEGGHVSDDLWRFIVLS